MRIMKNTTTMSILAIVALSVLLIVASALGPATDAFAKKHKKHHSDKHHNGSSQSASSEINQSNIQRSVCISGGSTSGSCNNSAANVNRGNAVSANVGNGGQKNERRNHRSIFFLYIRSSLYNWFRHWFICPFFSILYWI